MPQAGGWRLCQFWRAWTEREKTRDPVDKAFHADLPRGPFLAMCYTGTCIASAFQEKLKNAGALREVSEPRKGD